MGYQIILKQYKGSTPVRTERWKPDDTEGEQTWDAQKIPCRLTYSRKRKGEEERFILGLAMLAESEEPLALSLEYVEEECTGKEYVFFPAAVYDGNRMTSKRIPYPPFHAGRTEEGWESVITDIPHLDKEGGKSRIQFLSGDMSTPAMGYYSEEEKEGFLLLTKHMIRGRYTGFTVEQKAEQLSFNVSCPGVREEKKYFFGELPDGSGFFPVCDYASDDEGIILGTGEQMKLEVCCYRFHAGDLNDFFVGFHRFRESLETGESYADIPFSKAYTAIKEKYVQMNFREEGYFSVGTESDAPPACWQAGWVGGGINSYPLLVEDKERAHEQALCNLHFITEKLQYENGWYVPMYAGGIRYGDGFPHPDNPILLVRKDADLLYFLIKQAMYLRAYGHEWQQLEKSITLQADGMVRFYRKNGQLGQFINMREERLVQGDTASAAIASAALALAYEYLGDEEYLSTAEALGELYRDHHLHRGLLNGGPGEICQASDSESAFALLESYVQLYETTGKEKWLRAAKEAFELAITWVVSYDFCFPEGSTAREMKIHTMGTIFANVQNKHSAPGICTLSGNSILKLYRFTGDKRYLKWLGRISHAVSQFVSLKERPVKSRERAYLPFGYINERVQTSDWEGKDTVGEFLYASNWPEVTMMLTYVEIPGIYLDMEREVLFCFDHVNAKMTENEDGQKCLRVTNPTKYDAVVTLMIDQGKEKCRMGAVYFDKMKKLRIPAGKEISVNLYEP